MIPESGAEYTYLKNGFPDPVGSFLAFLCQWMGVLCSRPASVGIICKGFASYVMDNFYEEGTVEKNKATVGLTIGALSIGGCH